MLAIHGFLLMFALAIRLSAAVTCSSPPQGMPVIEDCIELVDSMQKVGELPRLRATKQWGRHLANTATTVRLPKLFWIDGKGPTTCGLEIDIDPQAPNNAVESFGLSDIGLAGGNVMDLCLFQHNMLGKDGLGPGKQDEAKMVKINRGAIVRGVRTSLQRVGLTYGRTWGSADSIGGRQARYGSGSVRVQFGGLETDFL